MQPLLKVQMADSTGTIDITDVVNKMASTFVLMAVQYEFGQTIIIPGFQWLALPFFSDIYKAFLTWENNRAANLLLELGFFEVTALRKPAQAQDYVTLVLAKNNLPPTATDLEYANAEQAEISAFRNFVLVTN